MRDASRDNSGFKDEVSDSDKSAMKVNTDAFIQKGFAGYLGSQSSSNRRRRATSKGIQTFIKTVYAF